MQVVDKFISTASYWFDLIFFFIWHVFFVNVIDTSMSVSGENDDGGGDFSGPVVTGGTEERAPSRVRVHFFESGAVKCPSATGGSSAAMDVSVDGQLFNGNASNSYFRETQQTQQHVFTTSTPNGTSVRTVTYTARQR